MKYLDLKNKLKDFVVFSLNDIRKLENSFDRRRLTEWQEKGYIKKIIKGYYIFSDVDLNQRVLFLIANKIYRPSYVSFESALAFYQFIPESIYAITSANTRNTYTFKSPYGEFIYRKIKPKLMFGYITVNINDCLFNIAEPEKAILDYFYIKPDLKQDDDFEELRIETDIFFKKIRIKKLYRYIDLCKSNILERRIKRLIKYLKNA